MPVNRKLFYLLFGIICVFCSSAKAQISSNEVEFAYSELLQAKAYKIIPTDGPWCQSSINLTLRSENIEFYQSVNQFFEKLSKLLDKTCPEAVQAHVKGYIKDGNDIVFEKDIFALDGWKLTETKQTPVSEIIENLSEESGSNLFSVSDWTPAGTFSKKEYPLFTKDKSCQIKYLSLIEPQKDWYFKVSNNACESGILEGSAIVKIFTGNDILIQTLNADFYRGEARFDDLKLPFVKYKSTPTEEKGFLILQKNPDLQVYSLIESRSSIKAGNYHPFNYCKPFKIFYLTESKDLFTEKYFTDNLILLAKSYVGTLCPSDTEIFMYGTDNPDLEEDKAFFKMYWVQNENHEWEKITEMNQPTDSKTALLKRKSEKESHIEKTYQELKNKPIAEQMAFLIDGKKLSDLNTALAVSHLKSSPVEGTFILKLSSDNYKSRWISYPKLPVMVENAPNEEWIMARLKIYPFSAKEKKKTGIRLSERGGKAQILSYKTCLRPYCQEYQDLVYLLQIKYNEPLWKPNS